MLLTFYFERQLLMNFGCSCFNYLIAWFQSGAPSYFLFFWFDILFCESYYILIHITYYRYKLPLSEILVYFLALMNDCSEIVLPIFV